MFFYFVTMLSTFWYLWLDEQIMATAFCTFAAIELARMIARVKP